MSEPFDYQSAPIGSRRILHVDEGGARLTNKKGEEKGAVRYAEVGLARFVTHRVRYSTVFRLDLLASDGELLFRVPLNGSHGMTAREPPLSTFYEACESLLRAIHAQGNDPRVELGEGGGARLAWFGIGVFCLLAAIAFVVLAFVTALEGEKLVVALAVGVFFSVIGLPIMRTFWPGKKPPSVSLGEMIGVFGRLRGQAG